jgi:hypothetical protein
MKAQVAIAEMIITLLVLFAAFNLLFPRITYKSGWKDALMFLKGRDIMLMLDRTNKLYETSFNPQLLQQLTNEFFSDTGIITWSNTDGVTKNSISVACNCTDSQINFLNNITDELTINNRTVNITFCPTNLENINPCSGNNPYPDALVIWGYNNLGPSYVSRLKDLLGNGNGILEIADLNSGQIDAVQNNTFGLSWVADTGGSLDDSFIKPETTSQLKYQPYKYFYHDPFLLEGTSTVNIPVDPGISSPTCSQRSTGNFTFRNTGYIFWVCDSNSVYWDSDKNGSADMSVIQGGDFQLSTYNFTLSYIDSNTKIRFSFKPEFEFVDFLNVGAGINQLYPGDNDKNKIFLSNGFYTTNPSNPIPVVIFNGTGTGKTAWVADFSRSGFDNVGDDHKNLLISLLLSVSNKEAKSFNPVKIGYANSYVNVNNKDVFEVYRIDLGLGFPF